MPRAPGTLTHGEPGSLVGKELALSTALAIPLFLASLAVTLVAARLFAGRLDRLGTKLGLPEPLIGLLTALAADGPEISSALFALIKGANSVGVGVLVGSNTFNLAAMLGVTALVAGSVCLPRNALVLEGAAGAVVTLVAVALLLGWISPVLAALLAAGAIVPYLVLIVRERAGRAEPASHPQGARARAQRRDAGPRRDSEDPTHHLLGLITLDVVLIVAASAGMVQAALTLGHEWGISNVTLGVLILAPLTSVPNAITGIRLGLARRGTALVGEAFNSNTINLGAGVILPSLFVTLGAGLGDRQAPTRMARGHDRAHASTARHARGHTPPASAAADRALRRVRGNPAPRRMTRARARTRRPRRLDCPYYQRHGKRGQGDAHAHGVARTRRAFALRGAHALQHRGAARRGRGP